MEISGRDKITQSGNKGKIKIDNRQKQNSIWPVRLILGILIAVIASGIVYRLGWT